MTDKTQATAHAEITAPISADLRRIDDAGAKSAPITLMTEDRACKWAWDQVREDVGTEGWTAGDSCTFHGFFLWGWNYRGQYETQRPAAPPAPAAVAVPDDFRGDTATLVRNIIALLELDAEGALVPHGVGGHARGLLSAAAARLAAAPAQAVAVTDDMALAFHRAISDGAIGQDDVDDIKAGLRAVLCNAAAPAQEHATQLAGQGQEPSPPLAVTGPVEWPATCDGLEQEAWEAWARVQRFDMSEHPMHYLFLNERTDAARQGWKGGLVYAVEQMKQRVHVVEAAPAQAQEDAPDPVRALIATHAEMLEDNAYAYFELAYTRQTGWMAWITDKPLYGAPVVNPDRKVLANGQGDTPDEACADAARAAQGGA